MDLLLKATIAFVLGFLVAEAARGQEMHDPDAAGHWYPKDCCSLRDCEAIPIDGVTELADGWQVAYTSEKLGKINVHIPRKHERVKVNEHDGQYHGCFNTSHPDRMQSNVKSSFICFWYPVNV